MQLPSESLLWRAILQVILKNHKPDLKFEDQHVGRTAKKCENFVSYVHKSFEKLNLELQVPTFSHDHFSCKCPVLIFVRLCLNHILYRSFFGKNNLLKNPVVLQLRSRNESLSYFFCTHQPSLPLL